MLPFEDGLDVGDADVHLQRCCSELDDLKAKYKCPNHPRFAEIYTKLGLIHQHMLQEPAEALYYHQKALKVLHEFSGDLNIATTLADIGHVQRSLGRHELALESYRESRKAFDRAMAGSDGLLHPARNAALAGIRYLTYT